MDVNPMEGMKVRMYVAADVTLSTWRNADGSRKVPQIRGNSLIAWHMEYTSGKWTFTTDAGKTYELMNPSMYDPRFRQLPGGEFVMVGTKYSGDSFNFFGQLKAENYLNRELRGISWGVANQSWGSVSLGVQSDTIATPASGTIAKNDLSFSASQQIGGGATLHAGISRLTETGRDSLESVRVGITEDFIRLLSEEKDMRQFYNFAQKYGIDVARIPSTSPEWIQSLKARLFIANQEIFRDNEKIRSYFVSLWLDITGWMIHVQDWSILYNSTTFRVALGYETQNGLGLVGGVNHTRQISDTVTTTTHMSHDYMGAFAWLRIEKWFILNSWNVATVWAFAEAWVLGGRHQGTIGLSAGYMDKDGTGSRYGLWGGQTGLVIKFGNEDLHFGAVSRETTLSALWIAQTETKNPGRTITTVWGESIGQYEWLYQFVSKSPADKSRIWRIIAYLDQIASSDRSVTLSEDFTKSLKTREMLKKFESYLEKNKNFFMDSWIRSLHFESASDWLTVFRGKDGIQYDPRSQHLIVRSFREDTTLVPADVPKIAEVPEVNTLPKWLDPESARILDTYKIRIDSGEILGKADLEGILTFIRRAEKQGQAKKLQNLTIHIEGDTQDSLNHIIQWDQTKRTLSLPRSRLTGITDVLSGQIESTSETNTIWLKKFLEAEKIKLPNNLEYIDPKDPRFLTTDWARTFDLVKNFWSKTYVYTDALQKMLELYEASKSPNGIWFLDRMKLWSYIREWQNLESHTLKTLDTTLANMSDTEKDTARLALHGGEGVLQWLIPLSGVEKDGDIRRILYAQTQVNTREKIGEVLIEVDGDESLEITIDHTMSGGKKELYSITGENWQKVSLWLARKHPELMKIILAWARGINPFTGKRETIVPILAQIFLWKNWEK